MSDFPSPSKSLIIDVPVAFEMNTEDAGEAIPFATTARLLTPSSIPAGTSNVVNTSNVPVATAIVL